jgi:hypothetical protein
MPGAGAKIAPSSASRRAHDDRLCVPLVSLPLRELGLQGSHACGCQPARLELSRQLGNEVPSTGFRGALDGPRECVFEGACTPQIVWPKRDRQSCTYVNSRSFRLRE